MAVYSYRARNQSNQLIEGMVDAVSEEAVAALLTDKNLVVLAIERVTTSSVIWQVAHIFKRVKSKDLVILFRQLAVMIEANVPIVKSLRILIRQTDNPYLKTVLAGITDEVEGGDKLSNALASYPDVFSDFQINIIKSGETSGRLSEVMDYLAEQQEKDYDLQSRVRGAMAYPLFILTGLVVVGFIMMAFVVPQMTVILADSGVELPLVTRLLIGISNFFASYWIILGLLLIAGAIGGAFYFRSDQGRKMLIATVIRLPVFGSIIKQMYIIRIMRSLSTLVKGGVPIAKALEVARDVVRHSPYEAILAQTIKDVEEGNPITQSFVGQREIPVMVSQMMSIGEESGELDKVLDKVAAFYAREIDNSVRNLSTLIEPIIMVVLGIAVGVFVAAIIMPMWQLSANI